ncbi:MAG TPA: hypothetical protein VFN50_07325 [Acidimicrobiales bacterium]|nr:hypothetical protein [Acidimicrobiales bacterium]
MADKMTERRTPGPVMVTRMTVDSHNSDEFAVRFVAELEPPPSREEQAWWGDEIANRVKVCGWTSSPGQFAVHVEAERDELEVIAKEVVAAVTVANSSPGRTARQRRFAADQAVLDRVMSEYLAQPMASADPRR